MSSNGDRGSGNEDRLDLAIDLAVREMLDVEPPAGLRGRVLDRLEQPRHGVAWTWIALPVAAAAVIVLAILVPSRSGQPAPPGAPPLARVESLPKLLPSPEPAPREAPRTESSPLPFSDAPTPRHSTTAPAGRPALRPAADRIIVAALAADDDGGGIDPLTPIAPIAVAAAQPRDITPKEIGIGPLAPIAELQIVPLSPPNRRN